ncbi:MAG: hypothetical protein RMK57_10930 [Bryobacterales bacterium]|nr:hypothetical protein [Bryobacteraceae bacterium]MDW8355032.1 hypothetical protein [Bryobacterales bacterium]
MSRVSAALITAVVTAAARESPVGRDIEPHDGAREAALGAKSPTMSGNITGFATALSHTVL